MTRTDHASDVEPIYDWAGAVQYTRQPKAYGGGWVCTLHMHDAENIIVGEGATREAAEIDALVKAGKLPKRLRFPPLILTAAALAVAAFAGVQASLASDALQVIASVVAMLTAVRLLIRKV